MLAVVDDETGRQWAAAHVIAHEGATTGELGVTFGQAMIE